MISQIQANLLRRDDGLTEGAHTLGRAVGCRSDLWPLGTAGLLGFTNGHLQSLALMHAPSVLPKSARDRTGPIINTALAIGTTGGSVLSFLLTYYLQRS